MGKLGDVQTKRIQLDGDDWVDLKTELLLGDILAIQGAETDEQKGVKGFTTLITDWSFTEDGTPNSEKTPINDETVQKLNSKQVELIGEHLQSIIASNKEGLDNNEKKASSSPLTAATETSAPII